jgi:peptidoglycan/xylan/chitin deacetylase (PgdA/CDA1 family)
VLPSFLSHGARTTRSVALTFHTNGDPKVVIDLLDLVRSRDVRITAFVVGVWLDANPAIARRLLDDGHELANHTNTHPSSFRTRSAAVMAEEIRGCRDVLERRAGVPGRWFRPSGTANGVDDPGPLVAAQAAALGYPTVVGYDVDPADYADPGAAAVRDRTLAGVQAGSIVSLHTGHRGTVDALPAILDGLRSASLRPVTLSTLLGAG